MVIKIMFVIFQTLTKCCYYLHTVVSFHIFLEHGSNLMGYLPIVPYMMEKSLL